MDRSAKIPLALLSIAAFTLALTFLLALNGPGSLTQSPAAPKGTLAPQILTGPRLAVYFTDRTLERFSGGPDEPLVESIEQAQLSVDVAAYDLSLWSVRDALLDAHERGVRVRIVVEKENADREEIQQLAAAGIPIVADTNDDGWMHDKFVIVDRQSVWTGSMNFTLNDAYRNDNHLLWIGSSEVAEVYRGEFEEMFIDGLFGDASPRETQGQALTVDGTGAEAIHLEVWFSPDDGVSARIVDLIHTAQDSIHFLAFSFTSDDIAEAIMARSLAGVYVQGVFDEGQLENPGGEFARMLAAGLDVSVDGNPDKLHHKLIVIDGKIVIAGSYNFSARAEERNDENVVILFDEAVAQVFMQEVARVVGEAQR